MAALGWLPNLDMAGSDSGAPPDTRRFMMMMGIGRGVLWAFLGREVLTGLARVLGLIILGLLLGG